MWDTLGQIATIPFALAMGSVFLVALGLPWIAAAWVFSYVMRGRMGDGARLAIASLIAACGIAPLVYAHGVINVYMVAMDGGRPPIVPSLASVAVTWAIVFAVARLWLAKRRGHAGPARDAAATRSPRVMALIAVAGFAVLAVLVYRWYMDNYADADVRVVTVANRPAWR